MAKEETNSLDEIMQQFARLGNRKHKMLAAVGESISDKARQWFLDFDKTVVQLSHEVDRLEVIDSGLEIFEILQSHTDRIRNKQIGLTPPDGFSGMGLFFDFNGQSWFIRVVTDESIPQCYDIGMVDGKYVAYRNVPYNQPLSSSIDVIIPCGFRNVTENEMLKLALEFDTEELNAIIKNAIPASIMYA